MPSRGVTGQSLVSLLSALILLFPLLVVGTITALAASDTAPPTLHTLSVSPTAVDTTAGPQTVTAIATVTDDLSGVQSVYSWLQSPSNNQYAYADFQHTTGDEYKAQITIGQYAEDGVWTIPGDDRLGMCDKAGNCRNLYAADLAAMGITIAVTVSGPSDTAPPTLHTLSVSPTAVDTTAGPQTVTAIATVTDDLSGVQSVYSWLQSPSNNQYAYADFQHTTGDEYKAQITIGQYAEDGVWTIPGDDRLGMCDKAGNCRNLYAADLAAMGITIAVRVNTPLHVNVSDSGYKPKSATIKKGSTVQWDFNGLRRHTVTDASGMSLFDSGIRVPGSSFQYTFIGAGTFKYRDTLHPTLTGKVAASADAAPLSGGVATTFTVLWATAAPPFGYVYDVQIRRPGTTGWKMWRKNQTILNAAFTQDAGVGAYSFRARVRKLADATHSGWSPAVSVSVT